MDNKKILIIDDDTRNIFALKAVLKSRGYECVTATSAAEGIAIMRNQPTAIAIALLDMMMPEMDGYQALAEIKKDNSISHISVIAVTAQAMSGDKEKCLEAGADGYVSKPIDINKLEGYLKNAA